ncbi:BamA/TamA family outer membrane protein [Cecembia sp.]|uniref:BamA/TamA family outer membrane protein n=1 Tax=Cecembia sp. TaxID=1898110 RepID=UPI0025C3B4E6|nr:BamA/TamA family outer membrane protein [Cecembia sp.]
MYGIVRNTALILITFILCSLAEKSWGQVDDDSVPMAPPDKVVINNIYIIGNEKTRKNIILREIDLSTGIFYDWEELVQMIEADQKKIYNLQLFNTVEITPLITGPEQVELLVAVTERWYIIPNIILNLADRNLAEWWTNQNRDLSRLNYGGRLIHNNVGGRNEKLRVGGQFGFVRSAEIGYSKPYIDKNQKHGLAAQFTYFTQRTIPVRSADNKQIFYRNENEEVLRRNSSAFLRYTYRGSFYNFHFVTLGYTSTWINEDVFTQNPNYFIHGDNRLQYFLLSYNYRHDNRDNIAYATEGQLLNLALTRYGLFGGDDVQDTEFTMNANKYKRLSNKFHVVTGLSFNYFFGQQQPFTLVRGIGYNPYFIRGYELNVVEGQQVIVHKNSLRFKLLDTGLDIGNYMPLDEFAYIPFRVFLSANFDHGYVNDRNQVPENLRLTNRYLFGYGLGLDLVSLYDMVFRVEYSINSQNEGAFFLNIRAPF